MDPRFQTAELAGLIPVDHREAYDANQVLARLVDQSLFWEVMPEVGEEMICGVGRVAGLYAGFVINRQGLVGDPEHPNRQRPAGILYRGGIAKISAFSRACNDDGIPLIWLQDISGFDIGREAEAHGLLAYGSSLIYTNSTNTTPMFTVLLRKASGAGYYAMSGLPYDPVMQISTTLSRLSVMEGRTLAIAAFNTKLDDEFEIATKDPAERAKIEAGMKDTEARIEGDMDPYKAAAQMDTDVRDLPPAERSAKMREQLAKSAEVKEKVTEMREPKLKEALTAEQFARIKEIKVQAAGVAALAHADVVKGLGLSDEQQKKIADIRAEGNKSISDLNPFRQGAGRNGNIQETPAKVREIHAATLTKATDVLDAGQKEKFAALKGKPFDLAQLGSFTFGFGDAVGQRGRFRNNDGNN
jgi:hypothetical protein